TVTADLVTVGPECVEAMGMKLVSGSSDLPTHAGGPVPALVNEEMVRRLWPSQHAIGRIFYRGDTPHQVAGVVRNLKMRTLGETTRSAFFPVLDSAFQGGAPIGFRVLVRSNGSVPPDLLRRELRVSFPSVSLFDVERVEDHVTNAQILPRMAAVIFGFAGCTALLLAITGLFGVVHYSVSRRSREFGIRMAVGADSSRILCMVLRQGSLLAALGVAIGLAAALAASRLLAGILYGVSPNDALTFTVAPAMLLAVALLACLVPAWRASRLHPSSALREE
ncbi:MAG: FtsX-like permease family protein, partial [Bryobacterales bacterium]|nr:FtsX-like permease family protein [Bryobacterales bacterium]